MKKGDFLFVYGTLRKGERADLDKSASQFSVSFIGKTFVNGLLYHLGGFPGLKLFPELQGAFNGDMPKVAGESYFVKDASIGALLDAYEGYRSADPKGGLYDREQVEDAFGRTLWVYTYNHPVRDDQLIETGDWQNPRLAVSRQIPRLIP